MAGEAVLIVDDNATNLKLARIILEQEGYVVRTAEDAVQARRVLETFAARVILMDIQLPGMDGLQLTRELKNEARFRDVLIIAVTAYAMKGDEEKAMAAGCDGYVTKPLDVDLLPQYIAARLAHG